MGESTIKSKYGIGVLDPEPIDPRCVVNSLSDIANAANYYDGFEGIKNLQDGLVYDIKGKKANGEWNFVPVSIVIKDRPLMPNASLLGFPENAHKTLGGVINPRPYGTLNWHTTTGGKIDPEIIRDIDEFPFALRIRVPAGSRFNFGAPTFTYMPQVFSYGIWLKIINNADELILEEIGGYTNVYPEQGNLITPNVFDRGDGWKFVYQTNINKKDFSAELTHFQMFKNLDNRGGTDTMEILFAFPVAEEGNYLSNIYPTDMAKQLAETMYKSNDLLPKQIAASVSGFNINPMPDWNCASKNEGDTVPYITANVWTNMDEFCWTSSKGNANGEVVDYHKSDDVYGGVFLRAFGVATSISDIQIVRKFSFAEPLLDDTYINFRMRVRFSRNDQRFTNFPLSWDYDESNSNLKASGGDYQLDNTQFPANEWVEIAHKVKILKGTKNTSVVVMRLNSFGSLTGSFAYADIDCMSYNFDNIPEDHIKEKYLLDLKNANKPLSKVFDDNGNNGETIIYGGKNPLPNFAFQNESVGAAITKNSTNSTPVGVWRHTEGGGKVASDSVVIADEDSISGKALKISMVDGSNDFQLYQIITGDFGGKTLRIVQRVKFSHAVAMNQVHLPIYCFDSENVQSVVYTSTDLIESGATATPGEYLEQFGELVIPEGTVRLSVCGFRSGGIFDGTEGYHVIIAGVDYSIDGTPITSIRIPKEDERLFAKRDAVRTVFENTTVYQKLRALDIAVTNMGSGSADFGFIHKIPHFARKVYSRPYKDGQNPNSLYDGPAKIVLVGDSIVNQQWFRSYVLPGSSSGNFIFEGLDSKFKNAPFFLFPSAIGGASFYLYSVYEWYAVLSHDPDLVIISSYTNDFGVDYSDIEGESPQLWDNNITPNYRDRMEELIRLIKTYSNADIVLETVSIGPSNTWDKIKESPGYKIAKSLAIKHNIGFFDKARFMYEKLTELGWTDSDFNSGWDDVTPTANETTKWFTWNIYGNSDSVHPSTEGRKLMAMAFASQFPSINEWNGKANPNMFNAVTEKVNIITAESGYRKHGNPFCYSPNSSNQVMPLDFDLIASSIYGQYYLVRELVQGGNLPLIFKVKGSHIDVLYRTAHNSGQPTTLQFKVDGVNPSTISRCATWRIDGDQANYANSIGERERTNIIHRIDHNWTVSEKLVIEFTTDAVYQITGSVSGLLTNVLGGGDKDSDNIFENAAGEQIIIYDYNFQISNGVRAGDKFYLFLGNALAVPQYNGDNYALRKFPLIEVKQAAYKGAFMMALYWITDDICELREVSEMKSDFNTWEDITIRVWDTIDVTNGAYDGVMFKMDAFEAAFMNNDVGGLQDNYYYYNVRNQFADTVDGSRFDVSDTDHLIRIVSEAENTWHTVEVKCIDNSLLNIYGVVGNSPEYSRL